MGNYAGIPASGGYENPKGVYGKDEGFSKFVFGWIKDKWVLVNKGLNHNKILSSNFSDNVIKVLNGNKINVLNGNKFLNWNKFLNGDKVLSGNKVLNDINVLNENKCSGVGNCNKITVQCLDSSCNHYHLVLAKGSEDDTGKNMKNGKSGDYGKQQWTSVAAGSGTGGGKQPLAVRGVEPALVGSLTAVNVGSSAGRGAPPSLSCSEWLAQMRHAQFGLSDLKSHCPRFNVGNL